MSNTVLYNGIAGRVLETFGADNARGEELHRVALDDGRTAMLFESEIVHAHPLSWTCRCTTCTTARMTIGRAMVGA